MQKSYKHLPHPKQKELGAIIRELKSFPHVEMAILFGSHARGDWVHDVYQENFITYEYNSDFDIMVIVNSKIHSQRLWDYEYQIEKKVDGIKRMSLIPTPASIFVHRIDEVNQHLYDARYFFTDVYREGILLFTRGNYTLTKPPHPHKLEIKTRIKFATQNLKDWLKDSDEFYATFKFEIGKTWYRKAAFMLHQTVESLYTATHLVYTHYRPKLHDIEKYGNRVRGFDSRFAKIFPKETKEQKRLFKLLKQSYVRARYDKNFKITKPELEYLSGRVRKLQQLTKKSCQEQLKRFKVIRKKDEIKSK